MSRFIIDSISLWALLIIANMYVMHDQLVIGLIFLIFTFIILIRMARNLTKINTITKFKENKNGKHN